MATLTTSIVSLALAFAAQSGGSGGPVSVTDGTWGGLPDSIDHLKGQLQNPQIALLLDGSSSMAGGVEATACTWYAKKYNGNNLNLNKGDWMKSALLGCKGGDGILELWHPYVNFGIFGYGYKTGQTTRLERSFFGSLISKQVGTEHVMEDGWNSPMTEGLFTVASSFNQYINSGNSHPCRPNLTIVIGDGEADGNPQTFAMECQNPADVSEVPASEPWIASAYMAQNQDFNCKVDGDQNIEVWTIGVGEDGTVNEDLMQKVAAAGGGEYLHARNHDELVDAIEFIINTWVKRARVEFTAVTVQSHGFFSDNFGYSSSFRMRAKGYWRGTLKKHCLLPTLNADGSYDSADTACLFTAPDGKTLTTNPSVEDLFTGTRDLNADVGGTGQKTLEQMGATIFDPELIATLEPPPVAPFYGHRRIFTWRPDDTGYTELHPDTWSADDSKTNGCQRFKLINRLHGYKYDAECSSGAPTTFDAWPHADPLNGSSTILKYGECTVKGTRDGIPGNCILVTGTNDGLLHFFDAATGEEKSAVIPGELWGVNNVANAALNEHVTQPTPIFSHVYGIDGQVRLFHHDRDGDDFIDAEETALLIVGLGRGGKAYYAIPVNVLQGGVVSTEYNPVFPLPATLGTAFEQLRDTWKAPWVGFGKVDGALRQVAVFGSGHTWELDPPNSKYQLPASGLESNLDVKTPATVACLDLAGVTTSCQSFYNAACAGTLASPCYDKPGLVQPYYGDLMGYDDGDRYGVAYRLYFSDFDLEASDFLAIEDSEGNEVGRYTGTQLNASYSPWVYDTSFRLVLYTNAKDSNNKGFKITNVDVVKKLKPGHRGPGNHYPTVYVVNLEKWNGAGPRAFVKNAQNDSVLLRFEKTCTGGTAGICVDETKSPDLKHLLCPISSEVSIYTIGGVMESIYWGDECGQVWKAYKRDIAGSNWAAKRLVNLNDIDAATTTSPGLSKDYRRIYTKVDLVPTRCRSGRTVGVYFGTGDVQRPAARDSLENKTISNGRDVIGVVWDTGATGNLKLSNLTDVTNDLSLTNVTSEAPNGWYIQLGEDEKMLRDPVVIRGTAYWKTYQPSQTVTEECAGATGTDRIYSVNNCDGSPLGDTDGNGSIDGDDRVNWSGATDVGGGLLLVSPRDGDLVVSHGDISVAQNAGLNRGRGTRTPLKLLLWRDPAR
jgi:hypothetical protein